MEIKVKKRKREENQKFKEEYKEGKIGKQQLSPPEIKLKRDILDFFYHSDIFLAVFWGLWVEVQMQMKIFTLQHVTVDV